MILKDSKKHFKLYPENNRQVLELQCHKHCRDALLANKPLSYFQYQIKNEVFKCGKKGPGQKKRPVKKLSELLLKHAVKELG